MESSAERETEAAGEELGRSLLPDDVVYLVGELGAGKTCFARGLARGAGALPREVASPTFAIVNEYASQRGDIALRHLDLYRVEDSVEELEALGLPGITAGAPAAVEWPGKAVARILPSTVVVTIEVRADTARRILVKRAP